MASLKAPIFVVGTPRSGTTLTAKILGRHPAIFMPGETHYFSDIYAKRESIGSLSEQQPREQVFDRLKMLYRRYNEPADQERIDLLLGNKDIADHLQNGLLDYCSALSTFMELQMSHEGKLRWGNNAPKDVFYVDDILRCYPEAKFIICVRDIRDFLCSYKGKWKVTAEDQVARLKKLYHPVVTSMLWKSTMRLVPLLEKKIPKKNRVMVRYEDLVTRTEETVKDMCLVIEEEFVPEMLEVSFTNSSDQQGSGGVYSSSIGKWRDQLTAEEVWIAQYLAGKEMQALGYSVEVVKMNSLRMAMLFAGAPFALWRALQANRENSGPVVPYLARRIRALFSSD